MGKKFDAWADSYAQRAFGSGLLGDPTEEEKQRLRMQALGAMGAGLLDVGGWSRMPTTLGQGFAAGYNNAANAYAQGENAILAGRQLRAEQAKAQSQEQARQEFVNRYRAGTLAEADVADFMTRYPSLANFGGQVMDGLRSKAPPRTVEINGVQYANLGKRWERVDQPQDSMDKWAANFERLVGRAPNEAELLSKFGVAPPKPQAPKGEALIQQRMAEWDEHIAPELLKQDGVTAEMLIPQRVKYATTGDFSLKVPDGTKGGTAGGAKGNARQEAGRAARNAAAIHYAAKLTGATPEEIETMEPEAVEAFINEHGGRWSDGAVARTAGMLPWIGEKLVDAMNPDVAPYVKQMAGGQANVNNPAGDMGEQAFALARGQVPAPEQPLAVQARMVADMLRESRGIVPATDEPTLEELEAELQRRRAKRGR